VGLCSMGDRECVQVFGWFWQSFGGWGNCRNCFHARLLSCRIVCMQDCSHSELSLCKIVSMQDCFHARLSSYKTVFMQIVFMQDYFHARLLSCRISCNMQGWVVAWIAWLLSTAWLGGCLMAAAGWLAGFCLLASCCLDCLVAVYCLVVGCLLLGR